MEGRNPFTRLCLCIWEGRLWTGTSSHWPQLSSSAPSSRRGGCEVGPPLLLSLSRQSAASSHLPCVLRAPTGLSHYTVHPLLGRGREAARLSTGHFPKEDRTPLVLPPCGCTPHVRLGHRGLKWRLGSQLHVSFSWHECGCALMCQHIFPVVLWFLNLSL